MGSKPWRHPSQVDVYAHRQTRAARIERTFGVQWKNRIFGKKNMGFDVHRPLQLIPIGAQDMPELRVLVQPMFQQHYIYFMAHRHIHENMGVDPSMHVWDILTKFTERYSNPNASELAFLNKFYPEVDEEKLQTMTLADCAVRLLLDSKTWQRPTDSQHFSKACSTARKPINLLAKGRDGPGRLKAIGN